MWDGAALSHCRCLSPSPYHDLGLCCGGFIGLFGVGGGFLMTLILFFLGIPKLVATSTEAVQIAGSSSLAS